MRVTWSAVSEHISAAKDKNGRKTGLDDLNDGRMEQRMDMGEALLSRQKKKSLLAASSLVMRNGSSLKVQNAKYPGFVLAMNGRPRQDQITSDRKRC